VPPPSTAAVSLPPPVGLPPPLRRPAPIVTVPLSAVAGPPPTQARWTTSPSKYE